MTAKNFRVNNGITIGDIIIDAATNKITGLSTATPTNPGDVATKSYVDSGLAGLSQNQIKQGDTEITVTDTGSGQIVLSAESTTLLTVEGAGVTVASGVTFTTDSADINGGAIDGTGIGASTPSSGVFNALSTDGTAAVTLASSTTGTINNIEVGTTTAAAGAFTTLSANNGLTISSGNLGVSTGNLTVSTGNLTVSTGDLTVSTGNASVAGTLGVTGEATFGDNVVITGNLNVQGTETIFNTQQLTVDDNIISTNANISSSANMPRFSGLHIHRGTGSSPTELDPYIVWDDQYDVTDGSGLGGTFTFLGSVHSEGIESPNTDFTLADVKCNIIEATATQALYADIAERFAADAPMVPGAVVMLGGSAEITETAEELSDRVFGVISTQPAYMMNNGAGSNETHPFVAMTGRTPVRVTGTVNKGDRLVSSSIKGTARAASNSETINPFHVIGRALESKYDDGIGMVNCVVRTNN
jgi:hypothetical protein